MLDERINLAHQPAVALTLLMAVVAALFMTGMNLRNIRLWWLQVAGRRADGVVDMIEFVGGGGGDALRRPVIVFTTDRGERVVARPVQYRTSVRFAKGAPVRLSYAPRNPARIALHGYDFRVSEPVWAVLGLAIAAVIARLYFKV